MVSRAYTLGEFVERFGGELIGDPMVRIEQVASLTSAGPRDISFCHRGDYEALLSRCRAGALILTEAARNATTTPRIVTGDPYLYFAKVSGLLNPPRKPPPGIDPTASVAGDASIHPAASVGPQCDIGSGARIDADVVLAPGSKIGERVIIGAGTVVNSNAVVYADCVVGKRCIVHSGAVIGADGFGFAPDQGAWVKIPQIGRVVIGDDVEVGANTSIDRGALDDTIIEDGVKLDNQVQIGHNCRIGAHTAIAGCVGIAGSTRIGAHCMIGGAAMIAGHLEIADKSIISAGTLIAASITIPDTYAGVYPADTSRRWRKNAALLRNLDRMANRIKALEARLERLSPTSAHDEDDEA